MILYTSGFPRAAMAQRLEEPPSAAFLALELAILGVFS
jgi:hypothetical protein